MQPDSTAIAVPALAPSVGISPHRASRSHHAGLTEHCSAACRTERVIVVGGVGTRQGVVERVYHDHAESEAQLRDRVAELEAAAADGWRTKGLRPPGVVRTGPFAIDLYADTLTVAGAPLELAPGEWDLLVVLAWHLGRYVAPGELMGRLWPRSRRNG